MSPQQSQKALRNKTIGEIQGLFTKNVACFFLLNSKKDTSIKYQTSEVIAQNHKIDDGINNIAASVNDNVFNVDV